MSPRSRQTSTERDDELRRLTREHVAMLLQDDLQGQSEWLKETWQEATGNGERKIVANELVNIIQWLRAGPSGGATT